MIEESCETNKFLSVSLHMYLSTHWNFSIHNKNFCLFMHKWLKQLPYCKEKKGIKFFFRLFWVILSESKSLLNNIEINIEYTRIRVTSSYAIHLYSFSLKLSLSPHYCIWFLQNRSFFFLFPLFSLIRSYWKVVERRKQYDNFTVYRQEAAITMNVLKLTCHVHVLRIYGIMWIQWLQSMSYKITPGI